MADTKTDDKAEEVQEEKKSAGELAAEERATIAEAKAAEATAEAERLKSQKSGPKVFKVSDWPEEEWVQAEASTGKTRSQIVQDLNFKESIKGENERTMSRLEAKHAVRDALDEAFDNDPLSPKYKAEVKKFLSDIPEEFMQTPEGRKKWIGKAIDIGKRSVKITQTPRKADSMSTTETTTIKEKGLDTELSVEERDVLTSHGKSVEDYNKIKHPFLRDAIVLRDRPEVPRFGDK